MSCRTSAFLSNLITVLIFVCSSFSRQCIHFESSRILNVMFTHRIYRCYYATPESNKSRQSIGHCGLMRLISSRIACKI
ncbi:hypothetical protein F5H01DRAFT_346910, partial [Linnemannia elongata]